MHNPPRTFLTTLDLLAKADAYTAEHAEQVAELSERVGWRMGLAGSELRALRYAALLHDIGKLGVRDEVLEKPEPLTDDEYTEVKTHATIGAEIVAGIPFFATIAPVVRAVHERWDGSGYPDGLAGEAIPLGARIVCACDAYNAMTSHRPYRAALPHETAELELLVHAGSQFDPTVAGALIAALPAVAAAR